MTKDLVRRQTEVIFQQFYMKLSFSLITRCCESKCVSLSSTAAPWRGGGVLSLLSDMKKIFVSHLRKFPSVNNFGPRGKQIFILYGHRLLAWRDGRLGIASLKRGGEKDMCMRNKVLIA